MSLQSKPLFIDQQADEITLSAPGDACSIRNKKFRLIPAPLRGLLSMSFYVVNTIFWCMILFFFAFLKIIIPNQWFRLQCGYLLNSIANIWIKLNILNQKFTSGTRWDIKGVENLKSDAWYMLVANHQSWVDILVLQNIFYKKIPFIKFFLKKELIWVPFLGLAWWALDFPFMKRYSRGFLKKYPHLKGRDLEITRKACQKFKRIPISIMTFVEGTRLNKEKHARQKPPYKHLLRPKAGGLAFTLAAMGGQLDRLLDVTIVYPQGMKSFWDFTCGRIKEIKVRVRSIPIDERLCGDYVNNGIFHQEFQNWLNNLWAEKDARIDYLLTCAGKSA